jgi:hypothetical protein
MFARLRSFLPRRFLVADRSMEPTLVAGQGLVTWGVGRARVGQLRCLPHPDQPGLWLVKRVTATDGASMIVGSDNAHVPTIDSETFGPVDVAGTYRVLVAIPRRFM